MKSRISSFEFEETDEEDEGDSPDEKQEIDQSQKQDAFVEIKITEAKPESNAVSSPPSQLSSNALFDQGSQCIEMNSKNFCCISVSPIAG